MPRTAPPEPPADEPPVAEPPVDEPPADESPADESPADGPPAASPAAEPGFFGWIRRLDVPRRPGWLGGVCAGIAARLGIDPLLVRGVAVVIAVLGGPVALLYAIAWFLLPDEHGTIHARELGRGRVTRAIPGVAGVFLLSFVPVAPAFWFAGAFYWGEPGWAGVALRVLWTAVLLAAAIVVVVWLATRAGSSDITTVPATTDDSPATVPTFPSDAASVVPPSAVAAPGEPPPPPADASAEELVVWKQSQDEWQRQRALWAAEQRRTDQERQRAEAHARSAAALAASLERARVRRLTRPRAPAGVVFLVLGVALVAAALSAIAAQGDRATRGSEWIVGAAVLALVMGVGIAIVGVARRRSGFLSFLGMLSLIALLGAAVMPADRQLLVPGGNWGIDARFDGRYAQLAGTTSLYVPDDGHGAGPAPVIDLWQLQGGVQIELQEGATVSIELVTDASRQAVSIEELGPGRSSVYELTEGRFELVAGTGAPDLVLRMWVGRDVWVNVRAAWSADIAVPLDPEPDFRHEWGADPDSSPTPVPTPTATEGVTP